MLLHRDHAMGERPANTTTTVRPEQVAEWLPARVALVCEPAIETVFGVVDADAAGFTRPFSLPYAVREHRALRRRLEAAGVRVLDLREVLAQGDTEVLRDAARRAFAVVVVDEGTARDDRSDAALHHERTVRSLDPETLATVVMLRPTEHLRSNPDPVDGGGRFLATFVVEPLCDACFVRAPLLVTAAGAVVGRPRLEVRQGETALADLVLHQLGIEPVARIVAPGLVDGGDFFAAGSFALMGQGPASNEDGIGQLLDAGAFGDVEIGIVRDPRGPATRGRLDEYLTLLGPVLAGICEDRLGPAQSEVDVYTPEPTMTGRRYRRTRVTGLLEYLRSKGFHILTFTVSERDALASAGILLGPMRYLAPGSAGDAFVSRLRDHGVVVELLPFKELGSASFGPRSATQILSRAPEQRRR